MSASIALAARSCARCCLRTRPRTRLDFEVHGDVVLGSGGSGKISRQRDADACSPHGAAAPPAVTPCVLSYIPENLSPWLRRCKHRNREYPRPCSRYSETSSIETPFNFTNFRRKLIIFKHEVRLNFTKFHQVSLIFIRNCQFRFQKTNAPQFHQVS